MTLCYLCSRHRIPLVATKEQHSTIIGCLGSVIQKIAFCNCRCAVAIYVWSFWIIRTEHAHLITSCADESAIAHKEEIVRTNLLYITCLTRYIVAASYLLAKVRIACGISVGSTLCCSFAINFIRELISIITQTISCIKFQHKYTTRP